VDLRVLIGPAAETDRQRDLSEADLERVYAVPRTPWLRANMVATIDGAATGASGTSGSINNGADKRVFDVLRRLADVIVVGAGTARAEGYRPTDRPLVVVSRSGVVPETLRDAPAGSVVVATHASSPGLAAARAALGVEQVVVAGEGTVDLARLRAELIGRGWASSLCEGGPELLTALLAAGLVDELCVTTAPALVGGDHSRIAGPPALDVPLRLICLVESRGTLAARWEVER
jgi:riboflavin biosynthesis pyrimidine reductase